MSKLVKKDPHQPPISTLISRIFTNIFKNAFLIGGLFFLLCFWYTENYLFLKIASILSFAIILLIFAISLISLYKFGPDNVYAELELSFANWTFALSSTSDMLKFHQGELYVCWLPGAHVFGQLVDCHFWVKRALHMHIVDSPLNTVDYAKEVQPHLFISVPRIYEKVYSNLKAAIDSKAILKIGLKIPGLSSIFKKKLKEAAGFSNVKFAITGAAPINPDILKLFQSLDIPLFEGWGLTETSAGATLNFQNNNKIGLFSSSRHYKDGGYGNLIGLDGIFQFKKNWKFSFELFKNFNEVFFFVIYVFYIFFFNPFIFIDSDIIFVSFFN